jgi:hypothetical protein
LTRKITFDDLILIFGEDFIPKDLDTKILMKHFDVGVNRIIGEKTVDKIKQVLLAAIESTKIEQYKNRGGVIDSAVTRVHPNVSVKKEMVQIPTEEKPEADDKYGLKTIKEGIVSKRLLKNKSGKSTAASENIASTNNKFDDAPIPSVEDLTILSGGKLQREDIEENFVDVQKEISIRDYKVQDEGRSVRWGKDKVRDRKGQLQEINHPSYIFHSDLWQIEAAREPSKLKQCDILQHVVLGMVANNINVVMLENETEPFFVVEGHGYLYSKDTLKDKIVIQELIQLVVISCEAWQIALKRPEAMLKGRSTEGTQRIHSIDMTSVIPLADIRNKTVKLDNDFKTNYRNPEKVIKKTLQTLNHHRKNVIWTCGASIIKNLQQTVIQHKNLIEKPDHSLNILVIGTNQAIHPIKIKYNLSGDFSFTELLPGYCKKHSILNEASIKNILGCIPAIFDIEGLESCSSDIHYVAHAVYQRLGFSAIVNHFTPGYIKGNPSDIVPISKLDLILPPPEEELLQKFRRYGFEID